MKPKFPHSHIQYSLNLDGKFIDYNLDQPRYPCLLY